MQKFNFILMGLFLLSGCVSNKEIVLLDKKINENRISLVRQDSLFFEQINKRKKEENDLKVKNKENFSKLNILYGRIDSLEIKVNSFEKSLKMLNNEIEILKKSKRKQNTPKSEILYKKAMLIYKEKNYKKALSLFREFLLKYTQDKYSPNAQYWIGECYYSQNKFEKAKEEFQNVLDFYPKSSKAPDSQVKIGIIYFKQNKKQQAILELQRVLKMYPNYERKKMVKSLIKEYK